jgi:hypothetical protein
VNGVYSAVLREVDVPILDGPTCEARLRTTRLGAGYVLNQQSFTCAGGEAGKDACTVRKAFYHFKLAKSTKSLHYS